MNEKDIDYKAIEDSLDPETLKAFEDALDKVEAEMNREKSKAELLMNYINSANKRNKLVSHTALLLNLPDGITKEDLTQLLQKKDEFHELSNLVAIKTEKNLFYYNDTLFTERFATVQALIEGKDILKTIATVTRRDCEIYPRPFRLVALKDFPYYFTEDELLGAASRFSVSEEYNDIKTVSASNGGICFYSTNFLSEKYARALAEEIEVERKMNQ